MIRRRRRRRMIVGAAVVGAAAGRYAGSQQTSGSEAQAPAPEPPAPAPPAEADLNTQIQQLAQMHNSGVLTDAEFAAAKAKLLGT